MAGSFSHIVSKDGTFTMDLIDNLGDAHEALEECFNVILALSGGDTQKVRAACRKAKYGDPWDDRYGDGVKEPMTRRDDSDVVCPEHGYYPGLLCEECGS